MLGMFKWKNQSKLQFVVRLGDMNTLNIVVNLEKQHDSIST